MILKTWFRVLVYHARPSIKKNRCCAGLQIPSRQALSGHSAAKTYISGINPKPARYTGRPAFPQTFSALLRHKNKPLSCGLTHNFLQRRGGKIPGERSPTIPSPIKRHKNTIAVQPVDQRQSHTATERFQVLSFKFSQRPFCLCCKFGNTVKTTLLLGFKIQELLVLLGCSPHCCWRGFGFS